MGYPNALDWYGSVANDKHLQILDVRPAENDPVEYPVDPVDPIDPGDPVIPLFPILLFLILLILMIRMTRMLVIRRLTAETATTF